MQVSSVVLSFDAVLGRCIALAKRSALLFILLFSLMNVAFSAGSEYFLEQIGIHEAERPELLVHGVVGLFLIAIVLAPIIETLLLQQLPILTARRVRAPSLMQFAIGALPFALLHLSAGASGFATGLTGGAFLSMAYLSFISESKLKAFCITAAIHALHNLVPFVLLVRNLP